MKRQPVQTTAPIDAPETLRPTRAKGASSLAVWAMWLAAGLGMVLRVRQYATDRSLWEDEASVAEQIVQRSPWRLVVHPLGGNQAAPAAWLILEKIAVHLFGTSEMSLRLWPFVLSLLMMAVTPLVARKIVSPWPAAVATLLIAVSPELIYYGSEVKPYGSDAFAVLVILYVLLSDWVWEETWKAALGGVVIAAMCWLAFPAVFVAPGAMVVLAVVRWRRRQKLFPLVVAGAITAVSLLVNYVVVLRPVSRNDTLHSYWQHVGGFPPAGSTPFGFLRWLARQPVNVLHFPGRLDYAPLAFVLVLAGLAVGVATGVGFGLKRRSPHWIGPVLVIASLLVGLAVAAASKYPLAIRVAVWTIPLVLLLLAGVLQAPRVVAVIGAVAILVVSASSIWRGLDVVASPLTNDDSRGAYAFVAAHDLPSDLIVTNSLSLPTYRWYQKRFALKDPSVLTMTTAADCGTPEFLERHASDRIWLVFGHHPSGEPADSYDVYLSYFRQFGTLEESWDGKGPTAAYLMAIRSSPRSVVYQPRWWDHYTCPAVVGS